ncbi:hypothetical protein MTR67_007736 [Solanum verrucosum]|uniref:Uncharacterized protein n=1 Tax=Solanum verrucosum TaxID=315347 RepID=A0AAF0Q5L3_SOLVR|nr:hypothetical protein MTR67_007736 [Solanum verrucosum]
MNGTKLTLLKQTLCFVIENFGPSDRLAIVMNLLSCSIRPCNRQRAEAEDMSTFPVHTFGFGSDYDSSALYAISDTTLSFIESFVTVQDALHCVLVVSSKEIVMEKSEKGEEVYPKGLSVEKVEVNWKEMEKAEATPTDQKEIVMEKYEKGEEAYPKGVSVKKLEVNWNEIENSN